MKANERGFFGFSPWLIVGIAIILGLIILVPAVRSTEKEKRFVSQNLLDRASALIWALEAGSRTWPGGEIRLLQALVQETAQQPGVVYLAVSDKNGKLIAYSGPDSQAPLASGAASPASNIAQWRLQANGTVFEVYRLFQPLVTSMRGGHHGGHRGWAQNNQDALKGAVVYVGLDQTPYARALSDDLRNNLLSAFILGLLGLAGFISMFWAHNYRRSRRMLKDSRALAAGVIGSLPLGLISCDPNGKVGMINNVALNMLQLSREQAQNSCLDNLPGLDWRGTINGLAGQGRLLEQEASLGLPNGGQLPISLSASQIHNEDGLFLGHLFILRDVAEVKRLQKELARNERLSALGSLAAGVAHEIRNPLSSIKGLATYIAGKSAPEVNEAAATMAAEVNRLNAVVSELLEFARPGGFKLEPADLNQVASHALRLAEADLKARHIKLECAFAQLLPAVMINREKLTQALLNLFINAVQAMQPGGILRVSTGINGANANIAISDNGSGIAEEVQARLFTPYFTTKPGGTGLGLAIVHQIVEAHQGNISLISAPGQGSTFTVSLPLAEK